MKKNDRHKLIKKLIAEKEICRQEDFVVYLEQQGVIVTQATISRDVKDLQLIKVPMENGQYRYSLPIEHKLDTEYKLKKVLHDVYVMSDYNQSFCVLKVLPGNGPLVANLIEQMNYEEVFAVMDNDEKVMIFARSENDAQKMQKIIFALLDK
ncbi:arginine repressor [Ligilactobacillus ceti]|uniref:Arginine repressor n=1 Tax=Ligilactobacillus ceti DSM 22408 TaxID=1122146 RepID=A0A0R2KH09_9LACO|nr:ArgR family transcriptional regulator [Ligilactobacillus ceti]KRN88674.1 arginine repressor [Ligilactobacillus ceti DSM 22408]